MKVSAIIPNRNDTVMLAITVRSVLEALHSIDDDGEIVIVDNSDKNIWDILKTPKFSPLAHHYIRLGKVRLIRQEQPSLFAARMTAAKEAKGEYLLNLDSHMLIGQNTVFDLVNFLDTDLENRVGFAYAPMGWCGQHESNARHDIRTDTNTIYAGWGKLYSTPTPICWNFGSWMCRRDWLLKTRGYGFLADNFVAWGGGEFYVSIKSWLLGYENWAVPTNPLYHIGPFSSEVQGINNYKYRVYTGSGKGRAGIGILASFYALAGEDGKEMALTAEPIMRQHHGIKVNRLWSEAKKLAENDWLWLQKHQVYTLDDFWSNRLWESLQK